MTLSRAALAVFVLFPSAGCLGADPAGDVGFRIENRADGAYGLHMTFLDDNVTAYEIDIEVRRGEVGTHVAPLGDGSYVLRAEVTLGPGMNKDADDNALPPATTHSRLDVPVDGSVCNEPALALLVLREGGVIEANGQACMA